MSEVLKVDGEQDVAEVERGRKRLAGIVDVDAGDEELAERDKVLRPGRIDLAIDENAAERA